ncbi:AAA ATPase-like protein [Kribbella antiqua]|uniref:AAA ATPase-like protein n=1 Tax=Kribbella antiqua TaxID=2512217 RepID=A0A4R2IJJ0_9ACTN|nr:AAA ATPase-like protein [Kribbella antiqua]
MIGPAGIGKSALLDYVDGQTKDLTVIRATGSPSETDISYAGLSQLLSPITRFAQSLPDLQSRALAAAVAAGPSEGTDGVFPTYLGTMNLMAAAASDNPLVVLIDDAHWFDHASLSAVVFAGRRLGHDPVAIVLTYRDDPDLPQPQPELPVMALGGLDPAAAAALLRQQGYEVGDDVARSLVRATGGNPLALRDLPTYVLPSEFAAYLLNREPIPVGRVLESAYGKAVSQLPPAARQATLIAAVLDHQDIRLVSRALASATIDLSALLQAETAGLIKVDNDKVQFRHPLVRSAIVQIAAPADRRVAHLAAAEALVEAVRPVDYEARVWHLARACVGTHEPTAARLEELASSAAARGGYVAAALTFERAAALSASRQDRLRRLLAAADSAFTGGMSIRCAELLDQAREHAIDEPAEMTAIDHLAGRLDTWSGKPSGAASRLAALAVKVRPENSVLGMSISVDATVAAVFAGDMVAASRNAQMVGSIVLDIGPEYQPISDLMIGAVKAMRGDGKRALPLLDRCRPAIDVPTLSLGGLEQLIYLAVSYTFIDAFDACLPLFKRATEEARLRGAIGLLPFALTHGAVADFRSGNWDQALAGASEGLSLAEDTHRETERPNALAVLAMIEAARGDHAAREHAETAVALAREMGAQFVEAQSYSMLGLLELGVGHPAEAIAPLRHCGEMAARLGLLELGHLQWAAELIEAQVRTNQVTGTAPTLSLMRRLCHDGAIALNNALLERCLGLVDEDGQWEYHYIAALDHHDGGITRPFEKARTQLCFGESLRRHRRRKDARIHLTAAWEVFSHLGAAPWARRTAQELEATGSVTLGRVTLKSHLLTPQEFQVAMAVESGATNRQIANSLFLSQKTVEFHLSAIYRRLGLKSRGELVELMRSDMPT